MTELAPDFFNRPLADVDPEIAEVLQNELERQQRTLEMIASENFVPQAILECQGSVLTNKYAEGYPGKRYYGGCEFVDVAEQLAIDRCKAIFGADHVNVQPHAGAPANTAVYMALLDAGDRILGMKLDHVDVLAAAVVPLARIALRVLVRQHAALALEDRLGHEVLRRDHL